MDTIKHYKRQKFQDIIERDYEEVARIHTTVEKSIHDHDNDDVGTHLEPHILECEVGISKAYYKQS